MDNRNRHRNALNKELSAFLIKAMEKKMKDLPVGEPNAYRVETGILVTDRSHQNYEFYANAYDHQYGYYDEYQHYVQDRAEALKYAADYVQSGAEGAYGVVVPAVLDDICFVNGKLRENLPVENEDHSAENVLFSIAKVNGKAVCGFIRRKG